MRAWRSLALLLFTALSSGCSVYPLPQDTTGWSTKDVVANIRCQARYAVRQAAIGELSTRLADKWVTARYRGRDLARRLEADPQYFNKLRQDSFTGDARDVVAYYGTTLVTYEFTLQANEDNKQGASVDFLRKFTRRADTIGIGAVEDRMRDVSRIFTLHDTFWNLAIGLTDGYCSRNPGIDLVFPSKGKLPVKDLIDTYVYLNEWGTLDDKIKPDLQGTSTGPATRQMADTIMFTTKLQTTNNPTIQYNPVGLGFVTSGLSFTNENSRQDMHKVIITLTTTDVPDGKGDYRSIAKLTPDDLRKSGHDAVVSVREKNFQDDISSIARSINQLSLFGL